MSPIALSGCGTGLADITPSETRTAVKVASNPSIVDPLTDGPAVGQTLKSGGVLSAGQFNATRISYDAASQKSAQARPSATLQKNSRGAYDVTIAGKTTSFAYADEKSSGDAWEQVQRDPAGKGIVYSMTLWNAGKNARAGIESDENGQKFHKILGYYVFDNTGTGSRERGHFVVGNQTDASRMALKTKTATYSGYFYSNITPSNGTPPDQSMAATGGLKMVADFDKKTISGQSTDFKVRDAGAPNFNDQSHTIWLKETAINGNFFSGKMDSNLGAMNGSYTGQFYGGNAQEAAGVLTANTGGSLTEGFFTTVLEPAP